VHASRSGPWDASDLLVAAQTAALAGVAWPGRGRGTLPGVVRAGAAGLVVGGAALAVASGARLGDGLTPRVEPPGDAPLRTDGPYALSRHPLYAGLLAAATGVAVLRRRPEPLVALGVLSLVLHVKAGVEEGRLRARFGSAYADYAAGTPRLVPPVSWRRIRSTWSRGRR
jgi:protein-S-isoprenylcysteine O-methyltransferase Ste14